MVRGTLDIEGYRNKVESAHKIVRKWAHNTPILKSTAINSLVGCEVFFKCWVSDVSFYHVCLRYWVS